MSNKESNSERKQIVERTPVENTPFMIMSVEEGHFLTIGAHRLNETLFETIEEALEDAKRMDWNRLTQIMLIIARGERALWEIEQRIGRQEVKDFETLINE